MSNSECRKARIGFIGLGQMGRPMCLNLLRAGHSTVVYDIVAERLSATVAAGAEAGRSPADVASRTGVTVLSLPTPAAVAEVVRGPDGILAGARAGHLVIDTSSVSPSLSREMAQACEERGVRYLDAPVSGGVRAAEQGTLTIMVGGEKEAFEAARPWLEVLGKKIFYVGRSGSGSMMKLINQLLFLSGVAAVCEAVSLARKAGVDDSTLWEVIPECSGASYAFTTRLKNFLMPGNFEPGFSVALAAKDADLIMAAARELEVPLTLGAEVHRLLQAAQRAGLGGKDVSALALLLAEQKQ